jgi:hypothetical protein
MYANAADLCNARRFTGNAAHVAGCFDLVPRKRTPWLRH